MYENEEIQIKENDELEEEILSIPPEDVTDLNDPEQKEKIMCDFIIKQVIGEGTFATVRLAVNKQTGEKVAIKIMEKSKIVQKEDKIRIEREIKVLQNLRHPNIVHLYSVIQTDEKIYLIMEYVKGKELFDYIVAKKKLSEIESCCFYQQIISGIEYLHKIKYVHRDIKPENLLINEETKELKIVDFGLSNIYTNPLKDLLSSACGSPSYAAPEMLNGEKYRAPPVDIWSSGIVLYAMICGYLPFEDDDNDVLYDKICKGKFTIPNHVSEKARDLLNQVLVTDPKKRLTIYQIKQHPWFSLYNNRGKLMISDGLILNKYVVPIDEEIVSSMSRKFSITQERIRISILSNKHDDLSTIYYLLLNKKIKNKKKSVADLKSELFKKYCENRYNLFENYEKDLNKVLEDRKNGYLYNLHNLSQSRFLSASLSDRNMIIKEQKSPSRKEKEYSQSNNKILNSAKRSRYLSPQYKKVTEINSNREYEKSSKNNKKKLTKFLTNNNYYKMKNSSPISNKINKNVINVKSQYTQRNKINLDKKENQKQNKNENLEENMLKKNLIKHREKKVHYEQKKDKNKIKNSLNTNNKNNIKSIINNKYEKQKDRIKTALVPPLSEKQKKTKLNNNLNFQDLKKSSNYEIIHNRKIKSPKNIKSKSTYIEDFQNFSNLKDKISKFNKFKTPIKNNIENNKSNRKSKIIKPLDKNKTFELSERGGKNNNNFNKIGGLSKINKDKEILITDLTKSQRQKIQKNIINERRGAKNKNSNKNQDKQKLISFHTNNSLSLDIYTKILENPKQKIKHFFSYNNKNPNNKSIKNSDNNNEKINHNKFILFKQKNKPKLEIENNANNMKESLIDDDSMLVSYKKLNYYEPFDLNFAYIKPRKVLKEGLIELFEKNKMKFRGISNTKLMIELKKEDVALEIKFDKLNIISDDIDKKDNIGISIIKLRRLKGNYQSDIKAFENIIYKLK